MQANTAPRLVSGERRATGDVRSHFQLKRMNWNIRKTRLAAAMQVACDRKEREREKTKKSQTERDRESQRD